MKIQKLRNESSSSLDVYIINVELLSLLALAEVVDNIPQARELKVANTRDVNDRVLVVDLSACSWDCFDQSMCTT